MVTHEYFRCLGDPTRLAIIGLLSEEAQNVSQLVAHFEISRPAISRHLRVLRESGLAFETRSGRERFYALESEALEAAAAWLWEVAQGGGTDATAPSPAPEPAEPVIGDWRQW